jgi:hypothetical protein
MKLYSTFIKLPLVGLLHLGLACSPLLASANDSNAQPGPYQQDHGKYHYWADHRRDHRDYQDERRYDKRDSYRNHKRIHPVKTANIYYSRSDNARTYRIRRHHNSVLVRPYGQRCL